MHKIATGFVLCCVAVSSAWGVSLQGVASVNITSDTAANAKNIAFDEARRQIISDALQPYVDADALQNALKQAKGAELIGLISAASIDGEKTSDTTYSANISMTVDVDESRKWLMDNSVQNWLPEDASQDVFIVNVRLSNPLPDWAELNKIAGAERIDLGTVSMTADSAVLKIPRGMRGKFTIALRESGWRYADQDGVLRIWK